MPTSSSRWPTLIGRWNSAHHLLSAALDFLGRSTVLEHERELVAAEPRHEAALARRRAQPLTDHLEHAVAELVPEAVVDHLEIVEIDEQDRELTLPFGGTRQRSS